MSRASALEKPDAQPRRKVLALDWKQAAHYLDAKGFAVLPKLLTQAECTALTALYSDDSQFRSRIDMTRHGFGRGEYKYFSYPLPALIADLRTALYPPLADVANRWNAAMGMDVRYPDEHAEFLQGCHQSGQTRPTPLLLKYVAGDYNCLHQDVYGEHVFPLQVAILLAEPGRDFTGGEFVLSEQRPRMQSRASVVPLGQGDAVAFAVHHRPVHAWDVSRQPSPRGERNSHRATPHGRHHFSRRCLIAAIRLLTGPSDGTSQAQQNRLVVEREFLSTNAGVAQW